MNSKTKSEYEQKIGRLEYLDDKYEDYPKRHKGDFRYLIIDSYKYPFKIYLPNEVKSSYDLDDLVIGDEVKIYYYENEHTHQTRINKFAQFVDKGNVPYFVRGNFQKNIGYSLIGLALSLNLLSWFLWKKKHLKW